MPGLLAAGPKWGLYYVLQGAGGCHQKWLSSSLSIHTETREWAMSSASAAGGILQVCSDVLTKWKVSVTQRSELWSLCEISFAPLLCPAEIQLHVQCMMVCFDLQVFHQSFYSPAYASPSMRFVSFLLAILPLGYKFVKYRFARSMPLVSCISLQHYCTPELNQYLLSKLCSI